MIYKPEFAAQASTMCRLGATDEELAEHFEVCVRTIYRWRNTHEEFADAVVVGKHHADARVERALYSRAVGCSVERTKVFKSASDPKPVYATYTHHFPPDPNAALHWLRVRQPRKWQIHEEVKSDPGAIEMIEKALARAAKYTSPCPMPPRQPPPEAAAPEPPPEPQPPPEPDSAPAPSPDPFLPPDPPTRYGDRHGYCSLYYPKPSG
ncbi:MAG: hypothetical protein ABIO86_11460 [Sphingomonas sp.]